MTGDREFVSIEDVYTSLFAKYGSTAEKYNKN